MKRTSNDSSWNLEDFSFGMKRTSKKTSNAWENLEFLLFFIPPGIFLLFVIFYKLALLFAAISFGISLIFVGILTVSKLSSNRMENIGSNLILISFFFFFAFVCGYVESKTCSGRPSINGVSSLPDPEDIEPCHCNCAFFDWNCECD
jgi:hypothetical protein